MDKEKFKEKLDKLEKSIGNELGKIDSDVKKVPQLTKEAIKTNIGSHIKKLKDLFIQYKELVHGIHESKTDEGRTYAEAVRTSVVFAFGSKSNNQK